MKIETEPCLPWQQRVGNQRDWVWRGWQTRYTFLRDPQTPIETPPLILLHGFGASIGHWRHNITELGQSHAVYALDMLGFGATEKPITTYNVSLWVDQIYDFWQTLIRKPVVLVGNSIGSLVCMAAAAAHPEMVQGIVMMSLPDPHLEADLVPAPLRPLVMLTKKVVAALLMPAFYVVRRPGFVRQWAGVAYANPEAVTDELVEILVGPAQDRGAVGAFAAIFKGMSLPEPGLSARLLLPTLTIPILLIWGKQDRMVPYPLARPQQFIQYNPRLTLIELEDCGHCPHDECPEPVNQAILEWIKSWSRDLVDSPEQDKIEV
ncbi:alpha/beta hydrolase [Leptolyngbya sp. 'hensonii']|uniref:alpha/beta fold hydrolase n=1 Tax=Leptolyngbya sp. 'hensonii' TaxID=1922337 RepID=UPI00094F96E6|nr:alpha/beta fold hydrolase [Leptolyngbya sp. 'hensonii']OLP17177.1 alpha/beta hydrolase [Leptolyngbya sp. 'hensonii']